MFRPDFIRDNKFWLLVLSGILAIMLGFFGVKGQDAISWVGRGGYWVMLVTFCIWLTSLWQCYGPEIRSFQFKRFDYKIGALVLAGGTVLIIHEGFGFKILMDEIMLLSTSMNMHYNRLAVISSRGNDLNGAFLLLDEVLDKRPLFHPFLLSLVHDFTGYRPENAFILNGVLVFVFLFLLARFGGIFAGRAGAVLCVVLFAGLPLLGQNACGGGFELLNLVLAVSVVLLALRWAEKRDGASLTAMCYAAILLMQIRYESILLAAPVFLSVIWVWNKERRFIMDWRVAMAPLLLVVYALHNQVFRLKSDAYQLLSKPGFDQPFSLSYIPDNLVHAYNFFFAKSSDQPNSFLFSLLGWVLMPLALIVIYRWMKSFKGLGEKQATLVFFFIGFGAHFIFMMAYFWGQFDDTVIRRLSLPTHLWLLMAVLIGCSLYSKLEKLHWYLSAAACMFALSVSIPAMSSQRYFQGYTPMRETEWRRAFIKQYPLRDYLVIDNDSYIWVTHRVSATSVSVARSKVGAIAYHLKNASFTGVYVYQRIEIDGDTGVGTVRKEDDLGPDYELVPIREQRFNLLVLSRLSRVVSVREGGTVYKAVEPSATAPQFSDPVEADRMRYKYLENFIKKLP